ncbi:MAG: hypothetical protein ACRBN8_34340 [Nannocystales bacterium]
MLDEDRFATLLRRAMVLMTRGDGHVDTNELVRILWIMRRRFKRTLEPEAIVALINEQVASGVRLHELLAEHADSLEQEQKRLGETVDEEDALMARIAQSLRIGPQGYRTLMRQAMVARESL